MQNPVRPRHGETEPVGIQAEEHFGQQIAEDVKQQHEEQKQRDEPAPIAGHEPVQTRERQAEDDEIRQCVAHQDGPEKILRLVQATLERARRGPSGALQLPDAEPVQRKHARLHPGEEERQADAHGEQGKEERIHFSASTRSSRTLRSSAVFAVSFSPRNTAI